MDQRMGARDLPASQVAIHSIVEAKHSDNQEGRPFQARSWGEQGESSCVGKFVDETMRLVLSSIKRRDKKSCKYL